jgi:methylglyoxal/glyoxal reductase
MAVVMDTVTLNNGVVMPLIGMGTWPLNGLKLALLVRKAVKAGYRSFDLASVYGNEKWFGRGLRFCGQRREELFVTTKLSNTDQRAGDVGAALRRSLARLGVKYVDLYLMHWPLPDVFVSSWKQMEVLYKEGLTRAIGVCNCHQHHLNALLKDADIVPAVNQVELHPLLSQAGLVMFCKERGIQVEAYSPFARMHEKLMKNETLTSIAEKYRRTVGQVILRWNVQHGIAAVPKTSHPARLRENIGIGDFSLSDEEMERIDSLNIEFRVRFDPDNCDFSKL